MASNIVRFDGDNGIEILIDTATGESFASVSGYARMAGVSKQAVSKRLTVNLEPVKTTEIQTATGLKTVRLVTENLICEWLPDDNPEAAKALLKLGVRAYLHTVAGYQVTSSAIPGSTKTFTIEMAVRRSPATWERMFSREWITEAEKLTGYKWTWKAMSAFIVSTVYAYLPCDVVLTLRQLNPKDEQGNRNFKHHQFLQPEIKEIVIGHLNIVEDLMKAAKGNMSLFELIMANRFGRYRLLGADEGQMLLFEMETTFHPRLADQQ